jgi:hypothetical protein
VLSASLRARLHRQYFLGLWLLAFLCLDFIAPIATLALTPGPACDCCKRKHAFCRSSGESHGEHGSGWHKAPSCSDGCRRPAAAAASAPLLSVSRAETSIEFAEVELPSSYQSIRVLHLDDAAYYQRPPPLLRSSVNPDP